jgi:hypothetical protein
MNTSLSLICLSIVLQTTLAQESPPVPKPLFPEDPKGLNFPAAVPRMVDTNGNVVWIDEQFTTKAYQRAAFLLVLQEANRVAKELTLPEKLPIAESNLVETFIGPFGYNYVYKRVGNITTRNYWYGIEEGNKFSGLTIANYDQICIRIRDQGALPIEQINTNAAFHLAAQWLTAASMDVKGLNRDCKAHIALSPFWNGLAHLGEMPQKRFVPIYYVWWTSPENDQEGHGSVASVELYAPTKKLLQLSVSNSKYILRTPLIFTNLDSLLPGTAPVINLPPPQPGPQMHPG